MNSIIITRSLQCKYVGINGGVNSISYPLDICFGDVAGQSRGTRYKYTCNTTDYNSILKYTYSNALDCTSLQLTIIQQIQSQSFNCNPDISIQCSTDVSSYINAESYQLYVKGCANLDSISSLQNICYLNRIYVI